MTQRVDTSSRIVVGVDGSPSSVKALQWALGQAEATHGTVEAVHAWDVPASFGVPVPLRPGEDLAASAEQVLARTVEDASTAHPTVPVQQRVLRGHAAGVLLDQASDADLLVLGSHGHRPIAAALLGSVSYYCVLHAGCPVVIVRDRPGSAG